MVDVSNRARMDWHGRWIWAAMDAISKKASVARQGMRKKGMVDDATNTYCLVRHAFDVKPGLKTAMMCITVDSRYKLFINGQYVGRGLNRCEAYYWYYNRYDITRFLREGRNVIAIHARYYGLDFAFYTGPGSKGRRIENAGNGGIMFDVELAYRENEVQRFGSGKDTRIIVNEGERSDMPLKNDALGFIEEFDARLVPRDWNETDFQDDNWKSPVILDYPVKTLLLDENHPLHEEVVFPSGFLVIGENDDVNYDMDEEDKEEHIDFCMQHMFEGPVQPLAHFSVENEANLLSGAGCCDIVPKDGSRGKVLSLYVRFPHEMVGYPRVVVDGPAGTVIDIIPSEKMENNLPRLDFTSTKRGSRVVLRGGKQFFEQWDWEGYLYMLVKIRDLSGPLKIHVMATNRTHMRVTKQGSFACNDDGLNRLWKACALTVLCCAIDGYLDCPSREQRAYLGDAYPEALIANACFGEARLTKKLIYDTAFGQRQDGITYSFHPGDAVLQVHIIPDYCLYWMQLARDYYQYYGDEQALVDLYPHFLLAIEWFWKYIDPSTGLISDLPYWTFIDWSFGHDKPGKWAILNAQFMDVLQFVGGLATKFGDHVRAKQFLDKAATLREKIDQTFWDPAEGCYRDFLHQGKLHQLSYMTNAYLVLHEVTTDATKITSILARIFEFPGSEENIAAQIDGFYTKRMSHHAFGDTLKERVVVAQPFFQHHVHKFFSKIGRSDLIMKYVQKWVPMLDIGKTGTIWETWSIDGSECHAWAATPAYDLSTYWLGVRPSKPGFESVEVAPTFHGLERVEGVFPACKGDIAVAWTRQGASVHVIPFMPK